MRNIKIESHPYQIPQSWEEITVKQFDKVQAILRDKDPDEISLKTLASIAAALTEIPMGTLSQAPKQLFDLILQEINFLFDGSYEAPPKHKINIEGVVYSFPTSEDEITLGQWVDVDEVTKGEEVLASIMAIMLLPEGQAHNSNEFHKRKKIMQALPCTAVLPLLNFFFQSGKEYTNLFQSFLEAKVAGLHNLQHLESTLLSGDGITQFARWHKGLFLKWIKLLKSQLLKC